MSDMTWLATFSRGIVMLWNWLEKNHFRLLSELRFLHSDVSEEMLSIWITESAFAGAFAT